MTGRQQGILLGRGNSELSCGLTSGRESHVWDKWGEGGRARYGSWMGQVVQAGESGAD